MREFTYNDYLTYAGAEPFENAEEPMIHELKSGLDIIADGNGVTLNGTVGTMTIAFYLYESRDGRKRNIESAANEWIQELESLTKHEQIALLHNIGIENMAG